MGESIGIATNRNNRNVDSAASESEMKREGFFY
jgi:hypothetical protein